MKNAKTILSLLLAMTMILSGVISVAAEQIPAVEKADRFSVIDDSVSEDGFSMISLDGELIIHINGETPIFFEDGVDVYDLLDEEQTLAELLDTRMLVVSYDVATFSVPPHATPDNIVVMYEIAVTLPQEIPFSVMSERFTLVEDSTVGDVFSMISLDGKLIIHINDETPIFFEDGVDVYDLLEEGQTLAELMDGRMLVVSYDITTRSIPPQTAPTNIIIMYETALPLPAEVFELNGEIVVNGEIIDAPAPYLKDGVIMVPIRAVAEALDYEVEWDNEAWGVSVGTAINLWIGKDEYVFAKMAPISLGIAPELKDSRTFVPMSFFSEVMSDYSAYAFEGQIVILNAADNDME